MSGLLIAAPPRPAAAALITAMMRLSRRQRLEVAERGRRAMAAKDRRIRRLACAAAEEARQLARSTA